MIRKYSNGTFDPLTYHKKPKLVQILSLIKKIHAASHLIENECFSTVQGVFSPRKLSGDVTSKAQLSKLNEFDPLPTERIIMKIRESYVYVDESSIVIKK